MLPGVRLFHRKYIWSQPSLWLWSRRWYGSLGTVPNTTRRMGWLQAGSQKTRTKTRTILYTDMGKNPARRTTSDMKNDESFTKKDGKKYDKKREIPGIRPDHQDIPDKNTLEKKWMVPGSAWRTGTTKSQLMTGLDVSKTYIFGANGV